MTTDDIIDILRREPDLASIVLSELSPLHRSIFSRVNGISAKRLTQQAIAEDLVVSKQYVQQIVKMTRGWLKHSSRVKLIKEHMASRPEGSFKTNQNVLSGFGEDEKNAV